MDYIIPYKSALYLMVLYWETKIIFLISKLKYFHFMWKTQKVQKDSSIL